MQLVGGRTHAGIARGGGQFHVHSKQYRFGDMLQVLDCELTPILDGGCYCTTRVSGTD